jgi:hypothetical protein
LGITQKERASELYWHHRVYIKSLKFLFPVRTRRRRRAWFSRGNQRLWRSCTATSERKGAGREREERDGGHQWLPRNKTKKQTSKQSSNGQISELFFLLPGFWRMATLSVSPGSTCLDPVRR